MNKIQLIIQREYLIRVKKKSFIVMTLLAPVLMAAMFIVPVWVATLKDDGEKSIAIIDKSGIFTDLFKNKDNYKFLYFNDKTADDLKKQAKDSEFYAVVTIPDSTKGELIIHSYKQPSIEVKNYISGIVKNELETRNLQSKGIDKEILAQTKVKIDIDVFQWKEDGKTEKSFTEMTMVIGFVGAILIYMFVFMYGAQVMRGVIDEKTSRVVEIIVSSVKPFQLMMGKILGIALVALTQFIIWIILTAAIVTTVKPFIMPENLNLAQQNMIQVDTTQVNQQIQVSDDTMNQVFNMLSSTDMVWFLITFVFYFIAGYLLYASLFAAVGSAVDNETDTQQFMLPISLPLILAFVFAQGIIQQPDGNLAFWLSIIPLTSPVIMMVRVAFGIPEAVPYWQLFLSMFLLVISFIGTTWLAAKIYRTGILMYGKKITYGELWKWLRYRN